MNYIYAVLLSVVFLFPALGSARAKTLRPGSKTSELSTVRDATRDAVDPKRDAGLTLLSMAVVSNRESSAEGAKLVIESFSKENFINKAQKTDLNVAVRIPAVARAVLDIKKLLKTSGVTKKDVKTVLTFLSRLKAINPRSVQDKARNVSSESVLLVLAGRVGEILTWEVTEKQNALSLLKEFSNHKDAVLYPNSALNQVLTGRGFNSLDRVLERKKEIRDNCKKRVA